MSDDALRTDIPHGARIWNYWLGGKDNYEADRAIGDAVLAQFPSMGDYARQSRRFLARSVTYLAAEAGVRQFLDVGTGLPTAQNTHQVVQAVTPDARVVYVDNDPLVLAHARALLADTTEGGTTTYLDADYNDPAAIIAQVHDHLDFAQPVAVLCMGVFGYVPEAARMQQIVQELVAAVPSGGYLAMWDGTDTSETARRAAAAQAEMGSPYALRTVDEIAGCFAGLEMVEPGLVTVTAWRPDPAEVGDQPEIDAYGGVGRKP